MLDKKKYGIVYTPEKLADFTAELLYMEYGMEELTILDPACGESALLLAMQMKCAGNNNYIGIDVDEHVIEENKINNGQNISYFQGDFLIQAKEKNTLRYWCEKIGKVDCLIANPPWSCERLYNKEDLIKEGYTLADGQYDNYFLFIEQSLKILKTGGKAAFILPDSIFSDDAIKLRKMLCEKTHILVIARLGEKIFPNVNRATTIIVVENELPTNNVKTKCFRLGTKERKQVLNNEVKLMDCFLNGVHEEKQRRFIETEECLFDVDLYENEEKLIKKLEQDKINWNTIFSFGRGVEISKSGKAVICKHCNFAQGYTKKQEISKNKICSNCGGKVDFLDSRVINVISETREYDMEKIYVGENLHRYRLSGNRYLRLGIQGINYKNAMLYMPPKIVIRKTGLGINAFLDMESTYISQTVYSCQYIDRKNSDPIEYYLALLNSRVIYYYYLKKYVSSSLTGEICQLARKLLFGYDRKIDLELEKKVIELYDISREEVLMIMEEINKLPNLSAINNMKFTEEELEQCIDI